MTLSFWCWEISPENIYSIMFIGSWQNVLKIIWHDVLHPSSFPQINIYSHSHTCAYNKINFVQQMWLQITSRTWWNCCQIYFLIVFGKSQSKCSTSSWEHTQSDFIFRAKMSSLNVRECISQVIEKHQLSLLSLPHFSHHTL